MLQAVPRSMRASSKAKTTYEAGVPESFNVLVKEVRGLGLNMELLDAEEDE